MLSTFLTSISFRCDTASRRGRRSAVALEDFCAKFDNVATSICQLSCTIANSRWAQVLKYIHCRHRLTRCEFLGNKHSARGTVAKLIQIYSSHWITSQGPLPRKQCGEPTDHSKVRPSASAGRAIPRNSYPHLRPDPTPGAESL